jgi:hypothetical protein
LDKKDKHNLQLTSLRHPKTLDEKALDIEDKAYVGGTGYLNAKSSFLKRTRKLSDIHSVVIENPEKESLQFKTPRSKEVVFIPQSTSHREGDTREHNNLVELLSDENVGKLYSPVNNEIKSEFDCGGKEDGSVKEGNEERKKWVGSKIVNGRMSEKKKSIKEVVRKSGVGGNSVKNRPFNKNSNLQKKLLSQKNKILLPFNKKKKKKPTLIKQPKTKLKSVHNKSRLTNILLKNYKKNKISFSNCKEKTKNKNLFSDCLKFSTKKGVKSTNLTKRKTPLEERSLECGLPKESFQENYLSSCNLVSTQKLDFSVNDSSRIPRIKGFSLLEDRQCDRSGSTVRDQSICFKTHQANDVISKNSEFMRDKENLEKKIAKIDQKLELIDQKLLFINKKKKDPSSKQRRKRYQNPKRTTIDTPSQTRSGSTPFRSQLKLNKSAKNSFRSKSKWSRKSQNPVFKFSRNNVRSNVSVKSKFRNSKFSQSMQVNSSKKESLGVTTFGTKQFINL